MPKTDPVHKVTIIPRGRALGVTMQLPEGDRYSLDKDRMLSTIAVLFGGRIAEEVFMHQMTTGASNDFERATAIARDMVTRYGMTDELGPMVYAENEGEVFLGRSVTKTTTMSEETMRKVDLVIRRIIDEQYAIAQEADRGQPGQDARDGGGAAGVGDDRFRPDRRHHVRQAAANAQGLGRLAGQADGRRPAGDAGQCAGRRLRMLAADLRDGASAPFFMSSAIWRTGRFAIDLAQPRVMGIVNVTPDSFSDGAPDITPARAIARCEQLLEEGADILDLGGESSRPGARAGERRGRARRASGPCCGGGRPRLPDLDRHDQARGHASRARPRRRHRQRHRRAASAGRARGGRRAPELRRLPDAHARHAALDAEPDRLRRRRRRGRRLPAERFDAVAVAGVARERIVVDPGVGFGKTPAQNLEILRRQRELLAIGVPLLAGWSRKSTLARLAGVGATPPAERTPAERARLDAASVVAAVLAVERGARIVRVHDVAATVAALAVWRAAAPAAR